MGRTSSRLLPWIVATTVAMTAPAFGQGSPSPGRWRFGEGGNGDLAAEVSTEIGRGITVALTFQCNDRGRYSYIGYEGANVPISDELNEYINGFVGADLFIETYANGIRTDRFRPTGFHRGEGDEVTDARLRSIRQSQFILITGAARPIALPSANAAIAIAQLVAACSVLRPTGE